MQQLIVDFYVTICLGSSSVIKTYKVRQVEPSIIESVQQKLF
jgi:hypothetical protein